MGQHWSARVQERMVKVNFVVGSFDMDHSLGGTHDGVVIGGHEREHSGNNTALVSAAIKRMLTRFSLRIVGERSPLCFRNG